MFSNRVQAPTASEAMLRLLSSASPEAHEFRRLQDKLLESEQRFQGLFEDAPVACHEIDQDGVVVRVNQAHCTLLGFEPDQMLGRYIWEFMGVEDKEKIQAVLRRASGETPLVPLEREYTRRDGATIILEIHQKQIRNAAGQLVGLRSFLLDVTQRKRAEEALQKQAQDLARSNAELEQFAYVASHDLQEPLRKIQAFGDRLKNKCAGVLDADGQDYLDRMQNASARMQALIQDLLALSRVTSRSRARAAVDLTEVVRTVVSDLESRIVQLGAQIEVGPLPVILADRVQIAQLFQNLIGNGIKFHKPGETPVVRIAAEVLKDEQGRPDACQITVEDNGIGFDEKYLTRIFQIFQRLHGRKEYEGSGIGLAICRKIVERHGGSITAKSAPGMGAKFTVTLPQTGLPQESCYE